MEFFTSCPKGFEKLLRAELTSFGLKGIRLLNGQVSFFGSLESAYRVCLWSRLASRVIVVLTRIAAQNEEELYNNLVDFPFEEQLLPKNSLNVSAKGTNASLRNTHFIALRAKDAIADRLRAKTGTAPLFLKQQADLHFVVRLNKNRALLGLDLAGEPLFHRRSALFNCSYKSTLRSDYAAALLNAAHLFRHMRHTQCNLIFCGNAQERLLQEALELITDTAAGLTRKTWGFSAWKLHDKTVWAHLLDEAKKRTNEGRKNLSSFSLYLVDIQDLLKKAVKNSLCAHITNFVSSTEQMASLMRTLKDKEGLILCNLADIKAESLSSILPLLYASRSLLESLSPASEYAMIFKDKIVRHIFDTSQSCNLEAKQNSTEISSALASETLYFSSCTKAALDSSLYPVQLKQGNFTKVLLPSSEQFVRRLEKVFKLKKRWAKKQDISCYRIYDKDLPDFAASIDIYYPAEEKSSRGAQAKPWIRIAEYSAPHEIKEGLSQKRLLDMLYLTPQICEVPPEHISFRTRSRERGGSQYALLHESQNAKELICEGGLTFELNFASGLDCGLFLDNRDLRSYIREVAKRYAPQKGSFLNLFAYTGSASCYAADGGIRYTTTVDISKPYLMWAKRNMEYNGFSGSNHEFVHADVLSWIKEQRHSKNRWDLIYLDPPTFSNSARMKAASFDIQRDHVDLIITTSRLLKRDGTCIFCCNLRGFKPDIASLNKAKVTLKDITAQTIPEDFKRNSKIHHAYLVKRLSD